MRKACLLFAALAAACTSVAAAAPAYTLADSAVLTVRSDAGEDYRVFVAWPADPRPEQGWPVLYLLDGDDHFAMAVITARRMARARATVPGVIVGIDAGSLARRVRDYTPDAGPGAIPKGAPARGHATGGADSFLKFVGSRIKPLVNSRWRIDTRAETLAGHSFGGLAALYELYRFGHFDAYAAVSPSLWYGGGTTFAAPSGPARRARVLIQSGSRETAPVTAGPTGDALAASLREHGIDVSFSVLSGQSHGTTMPASIGAIVRFAFGEEKP